MNMLAKMSGIARSPGDPEVIETGPSSRGTSDQLAVALGWFSLALGAAELFAPGRLARALGMEGKENLIRAYGVREIGAGMMCLAPEKTLGVWSRVAGDGLDLATLYGAFTDDNPKKKNVAIAMAAVAGVTLLDVACAQGLTVRHSRGRGTVRDYSDRSGFPKGLTQSRGAASDFETPHDMRAELPGGEESPLRGENATAF